MLVFRVGIVIHGDDGLRAIVPRARDRGRCLIAAVSRGILLRMVKGRSRAFGARSPTRRLRRRRFRSNHNCRRCSRVYKIKDPRSQILAYCPQSCASYHFVIYFLLGTLRGSSVISSKSMPFNPESNNNCPTVEPHNKSGLFSSWCANSRSVRAKLFSGTTAPVFRHTGFAPVTSLYCPQTRHFLKKRVPRSPNRMAR